MARPLEGAPAQQYAEHVKSVITGAVDDAALITAMQAYDTTHQNDRLIQGLEQAMKSLAFSHAEGMMIQAAIASLGGQVHDPLSV